MPRIRPRKREKSIESYFVKRCRENGVFVLKNTGMNGISDRLIFKNGIFVFVELKRPGERPTDLQKALMKKMRKRGALTKWADTKEKVDRILSIFDKKRSIRDTERLKRFYGLLMIKLRKEIARLDDETRRRVQEDNP